MVTDSQCEKALHELATRLDDYRATAAETDLSGHGHHGNRHTDVDRSVSCTIRDLKVVFGARLEGGRLTDIRRVDSAAAQIRVEVTSHDLLALVDGTLDFASAWLGGRVKIIAGVRDLIRLRSLL